MTYPAGRDPWPDTLRLVAVALVVVAHFIERHATDGDAVDGFLTATWALRVPLLAAVAGYFSSAEPPTHRSIRRLLQSVVVVYVIFDVAQRLQIFAMTGDLKLELTRPTFGMWFLLSLATWRVLLPYLVQVRWFGAVSVLAALGAGFVSTVGYGLSLSRTIVFFPFFLLGWWIRQRGLRDAWDTPRARRAALVVLAAALVAGFAARELLTLRAMRGAESYQSATRWLDLGWRAATLAFGAVVILAVVTAMPRHPVPVASYLGAGSMYAYLLHQPIHRQFVASGVDPETGGAAAVVVALAAVVLTAVLASPPVRWATRWAVQPRWEWLWRQGAPPPSAHLAVTAESPAGHPPLVASRGGSRS